MTFKSGDKVRLKEKVTFNGDHKAGDVLTLDCRDGDGWETSRGGFYFEDEFELVEDAKTTDVEPTLKVGDTVRILAGEIRPHEAGDIGEIIKVDSSDCVRVEVNGASWWYLVADLEVVNTEAPKAPPFGMTPDALAGYVQDFITAAKARVTGVGAEQYAGADSQKFERLSLSELFTMAREEAQDLAVYAAMIDIRLQRIEEALNSKGVSVVHL